MQNASAPGAGPTRRSGRGQETLRTGTLVVDGTGNHLTYRIIGVARAVHNAPDPGYKEEVAEKALPAELRHRGIAGETQYPVSVVHRDAPVALFVVDLFVAHIVVVELKAFPHQLTDDPLGQVLRYPKATAPRWACCSTSALAASNTRRVFPVGPPDAPRGRLERTAVRRRPDPRPPPGGSAQA